MRVENVSRLASFNGINKYNFNYLVYLNLIKDLNKAVFKYAKGKVIDIGCGNKPYENIFKENIDEYIGCDIMQSDLKKVDIICEANNIPLKSLSFDTAFSTQTIEHVADHQGLVNEAYRLLKSGGYFIVSGPLYWPLHEEPYDFFRFTKHGFTYIFEKAGFEIIEINSNGGTWATTGQSIIHSFENSRSRHFSIRVLRFLFFKLRLYWLVNAFFGWMDKTDYNPINTMNYVIIGRKPITN